MKKLCDTEIKMPHEPIKIGASTDAETTLKHKIHPPHPSAMDPKSVRVNKTSGAGMEIDWKDGHLSLYTFQWLRDACPCALCENEREKSGQKRGQAPKTEPGTLPLYREPARPLEVSPVGKYAISFHWNDGHQHGIYSWEYLRRWCPCPQCCRERVS